jgi:hypothetical protein
LGIGDIILEIEKKIKKKRRCKINLLERFFSALISYIEKRWKEDGEKSNCWSCS